MGKCSSAMTVSRPRGRDRRDRTFLSQDRLVVCPRGAGLSSSRSKSPPSLGLVCRLQPPRRAVSTRAICVLVSLCASVGVGCGDPPDAATSLEMEIEPPKPILEGYTADPHAVVF